MDTGEAKAQGHKSEYSVSVTTSLSKAGHPGKNIGKILHHNLIAQATSNVELFEGIVVILKNLQMGKAINMPTSRFGTVGEEVLCLLTTSGLVNTFA